MSRPLALFGLLLLMTACGSGSQAPTGPRTTTAPESAVLAVQLQQVDQSLMNANRLLTLVVYPPSPLYPPSPIRALTGEALDFYMRGNAILDGVSGPILAGTTAFSLLGQISDQANMTLGLLANKNYPPNPLTPSLITQVNHTLAAVQGLMPGG